LDFKIMNTSELIRYIEKYIWTRTVNQLHIHHTWKPNHSDYLGYNGVELQREMRNYHVNVNRWRDIAQHLTLLPDGNWVTGRSFNINPASIIGWNEGAFAIEMIGNFDKGFDKFYGRQAEAMFEFCAFFVAHMKLDMKNSVKFHRDKPNSGKTCPGSGINREWFMNKLKNAIEGEISIIEEDKWKIAIVDELASGGVINEPEGWKKKINESMPVWAVLSVCNQICKKISKDNQASSTANKVIPKK